MADEIRNTEIEATDKPRPGNPNEPMRTPGQNPGQNPNDPSRGNPRNPNPDPTDPNRDRPGVPDDEPRRDPSREDR